MKQEPRNKILIADDSSVNRTLLTKILETEFDVVCAEDGFCAVDILKKEDDISLVLLDIQMPNMDGFGVMDIMKSDDKLKDIPIVIETVNDDSNMQVKALQKGVADFIIKPFNSMVVFNRIKSILKQREIMIQNARSKVFEELFYKSEIDEKTGLYTKNAFYRRVTELLKNKEKEDFVIVYADMDGFKIFNDTFGVKAGDFLLSHIGTELKKEETESNIFGHWNADHFVACMARKNFNPERELEKLTRIITINQTFEFIVRIGIYEIDDKNTDISLMCDRALLALRSIKNDFTKRYVFYQKAMRTDLLKEQEILNEMENALNANQFTVYFQPQYNYNTKTLHGAEALVRWIHPLKGIISPGVFIPIFEKNGFISKLDEFVWERVCFLQRKWLDEGINVVPVSINISRRDIYNPNLCEHIFSLVKKYNLPPKLLRLEITESSYTDNSAQLIRVVDTLRAGGFEVEMDDFGSGYSSLNSLKTIPIDLLKMDMKFLDNNDTTQKGGVILTSVIRMAHWMNIPVLAEGVETKEQADYLLSVGCYYIQGFLLAKPMPTENYVEVLKNAYINEKEDNANVGNTGIAADFLSDSTQATLLFNSYVGGAAIIEYSGNEVELIRINDKFFTIIDTTREDYDKESHNVLDRFVPESRDLFLKLVKKASESDDEVEGELCSYSLLGKKNYIWTDVHIKLLAKSRNRCILYLSVVNISEKIRIADQLKSLINSVPGGILSLSISDKI